MDDLVRIATRAPSSPRPRRIRPLDLPLADDTAPASNPLRLSGQRGWLCLRAHPRTGIVALRVAVDGRTLLPRIRLGFPRGTVSGFDLMQTALLGELRSGRVLALPGRDGYPARGRSLRLPVFTIGLDATTPPLEEFLIALPRERHDVSLPTLSPSGDQVAWWLEDERFPGRYELWRCRSDGAQWQGIGWLDTRRTRPGPPRWQGVDRLVFDHAGFSWTLPPRSAPGRPA